MEPHEGIEPSFQVYKTSTSPFMFKRHLNGSRDGARIRVVELMRLSWVYLQSTLL